MLTTGRKGFDVRCEIRGLFERRFLESHRNFKLEILNSNSNFQLQFALKRAFYVEFIQFTICESQFDYFNTNLIKGRFMLTS